MRILPGLPKSAARLHGMMITALRLYFLENLYALALVITFKLPPKYIDSGTIPFIYIS